MFFAEINEVSSNSGAVTIIVAIIAAVGAVLAACIPVLIKKKKTKNEGENEGNSININTNNINIYNKIHTEENVLEADVISPPSDPLSKLKSDPCGLNEIDNMEFGSETYMNALATRIEMKKDPESILDVWIKKEE